MDKKPIPPPAPDPTRLVHPYSDPEQEVREVPQDEEPVRSGGDEDVTGLKTPVDMETYKARWGDRPTPGLLDTTPDEASEEPPTAGSDAETA
jgi:hypothetical protein